MELMVRNGLIIEVVLTRVWSTNKSRYRNHQLLDERAYPCILDPYLPAI
jgi:hypothetical protein